jgi:general secretion pathway protein H
LHSAPYHKHIEQGFTLLEVLLVITMMALISVGVMLSLNLAGPEELLEQEAKRFAAVVEMASEQALMRSEEYGLQVDDKRYQFLQLDDEQKWQLIDGDRLFAKHGWPAIVTAKLTLDDLPWEQEDRLTRQGSMFEGVEIEREEEKLQPQVLIFSSGDLTAFSLLLSLQDVAADEIRHYRINGRDTGEIELIGPLDKP